MPVADGPLVAHVADAAVEASADELILTVGYGGDRVRKYFGDVVLGRDVNLGAGTTVANLRHDGEPVSLEVKGERISTGRRKFGAVLGPDVNTGRASTPASPSRPWRGPGRARP